MAGHSAGLLLFRRRDGRIEVFLVHPGGPFWKNKDAGAWSIPKGEVGDDEDALAAARREFEEETGVTPGPDTGPAEAPGSAGPSRGVSRESPRAAGERFIPLGEIRQKGGKVVQAWAVEGECDPSLITSNVFAMEWPPRSGRQQEFPEIDRAAWFDLEAARAKINAAQAELLDRLAERVPSP